MHWLYESSHRSLFHSLLLSSSVVRSRISLGCVLSAVSPVCTYRKMNALRLRRMPASAPLSVVLAITRGGPSGFLAHIRNSSPIERPFGNPLSLSLRLGCRGVIPLLTPLRLMIPIMMVSSRWISLHLLSRLWWLVLCLLHPRAPEAPINTADPVRLVGRIRVPRSADESSPTCGPTAPEPARDLSERSHTPPCSENVDIWFRASPDAPGSLSIRLGVAQKGEEP